MAEPTAFPTSDGIEKLLSNPDLLRTVIGGAGAESDGLSRVLSDPALMAKLPAVIEMIKPMMSAEASTNAPTTLPTQKPLPHNRRDDLLLALKPFLSTDRAAAVDTLLRLAQLGSILQNLK